MRQKLDYVAGKQVQLKNVNPNRHKLIFALFVPPSPRDKISLSSNSRANETQSEPTLNERVSHATFGQAPQVGHRHHHHRQNGTKELENNNSVAGGGGGMFEHIHIWVNCPT